MPIRVVLAEADPAFLKELVSVLDSEPGIRVVAATGDIETAFVAAKEHHPDTVVLDAGLAGLPAMKKVRRMIDEISGTRVLVLSIQEDRRYVEAFMGAGVAGYLLKERAYEELVAAIRQAAAGGCYLGAGIEGQEFC